MNLYNLYHLYRHHFAIQHNDLNHLMCVLTPVAFSRQPSTDADQIPVTFVHRGECVCRAFQPSFDYSGQVHGGAGQNREEERKRELTAPRPGRRMLITVKRCLIRRREALR